MIKSGILNPNILSLLARIRHTNLLVIADRGFPFWPQIETIDLSLVDDIPTVLQVLQAVQINHHFGTAWMAEEFLLQNSPEIQAKFSESLSGLRTNYLPHSEFKKLVPDAIGLIRTGDTIQYANMIMESA